MQRLQSRVYVPYDSSIPQHQVPFLVSETTTSIQIKWFDGFRSLSVGSSEGFVEVSLLRGTTP